MNPNYLFLDTEWSDGEGRQLVSLALVSADGEHRFYAERDPLPVNPTSFVAQYVYPLLDRGAVALSDLDFAQSLRQFLSRFDPPHVLFDCANDGALLLHALSGFADERTPKRMGGDSSVVLTLMHTGFYFRAVLEEWFSSDPSRAGRRHHAAVDAEALRAAWLHVTGQ